MRAMTPGDSTLSRRQEFGRRIAELRKSKRLSKVKAAEAAGISDTYWGWFEAGERTNGGDFNPEAGSVLAVAGVVGIPAQEALAAYGIDPAFHQDKLGGRPRASRAEIAARLEQLDRVELEAVEAVVMTILRARGYLPSDGKDSARLELPGVWVGEPRPVHEPGVPIDRGSQRQKAPDSTSRGPR